MIRTQELVPDYYIEQSRDFQVLCRLYDFTYNALKFNIDTMHNVTDTKHVKNTILPLLGDKFGIYDKQSYSNRELLSALPSALYYKGSLKSVIILLNAYLDSLNIFDYAVAYHSKDEKSAKEISSMLRREIKPYSIVIVLSTAPSLVELHVLDEYLKMVLPCGMIVNYVFGVNVQILDKFRYNEHVFIFYDKNNYSNMIANRPGQYSIKYDTSQSYPDIKFIRKVTQNVDINSVGIESVVGYNQIKNDLLKTEEE